ncbi:MAG: putative ORFan [Hyperionvirus sp.]|uniref:Putative ORFan n=1 Tax=Hyperionvirus sp. TaxID=2487770 RepID=A0A3G5AAF8_9VIRU|nr:MAG: putative ORFan [Hyperionvirus sp.]
MSKLEVNSFDPLLVKYFSEPQVKAFKKSRYYPKYVKFFKLISDKNNRKQTDDFEKIFEMISYYSKIDVMFDIHEYFKIFQFRFFREIFFDECYFHIVIYCQKSWGFGDVMFGIKNKLIVDRFYPAENIFFVVRTEGDGKLIHDSLVKEGKKFRIYILEEYVSLCKSSEKMSVCPKQIYVGAVGANQKRFNDIPGKKAIIFLDEYNGWRIGFDGVIDRLAERKSIVRDCVPESGLIEAGFPIKSKYIINQSGVDKKIIVQINIGSGCLKINYRDDRGNEESIIWAMRGTQESFNCLSNGIVKLNGVYYLTADIDITRIMTEGLALDVNFEDFTKGIIIVFLLRKSENPEHYWVREEKHMVNPIYDAFVSVQDVSKRNKPILRDIEDQIRRELKTSDTSQVISRKDSEVCSCRSCIAAEHAGRLTVSRYSGPSPTRKIDIRWLHNEQILPLGGSAGIGLNQHKYPCMGIHLELTIPDELKDTKLISYRNYLKQTSADNFYFAYNSDSAENNYSYLSKFIQTICLSRSNPDQWINLILISRDCYILSDNIIEFEDIKLHELQKVKLRIFLNESISHNDMIYMIAVSQDLIFVSGDQSFAEVIALSRYGIIKILFYQVQSWKMDLVKQYRNLAHHILKELTLETFNAIVFTKTPISPILIDLIKNKKPQLLEQSGLIYKKIRQVFNFEDALISWVNYINMKLFFSSHPLAEIFFL